jgi:hypothetical protein
MEKPESTDGFRCVRTIGGKQRPFDRALCGKSEVISGSVKSKLSLKKFTVMKMTL